METKREPGFYWVRYRHEPPGEGWVPGDVVGDLVSMVGRGIPAPLADMEIGPRIEPPGELFGRGLVRDLLSAPGGMPDARSTGPRVVDVPPLEHGKIGTPSPPAIAALAEEVAKLLGAAVMVEPDAEPRCWVLSLADGRAYSVREDAGELNGGDWSKVARAIVDHLSGRR